eukprot:NODE_8618_length_691_cov_81.559859_g8360_i0.p1 GENE.NODE_8618_length_691_cov_81.559859_g8360_i0~~NODE_8618_length_691_cov_81.559859_g8360_i0.p1  ORF type:complete len:129 (+),score=35.28 NODE_8618_length_691_cov_81.559859_g8360_i0:30-416(+)
MYSGINAEYMGDQTGKTLREVADGESDKAVENEIRRLQSLKSDISRRWNELQDPLKDRAFHLVEDMPPSKEEQEVLIMDLHNQVASKMAQLQADAEHHNAKVNALMDALQGMDTKVKSYIANAGFQSH